MTPLHVPPEIVRKWQEIVDLLAGIMRVPSALIMQVEAPNIRVFVSSDSKGNPYKAEETAPLNTSITASISHELKQPICACGVNAAAGLRWLNTPSPNLDEARHAFERIAKDAMRASDVMTRIHSLVKNAPMFKESLQINEAIREVVTLTHAEASKRNVCVRIALAEDLPLVQGDRVQLQQVMLNLIINAIEAMSAVDDGPRELVIATGKYEPDAVLVTVRDTGPGVDPENIERVFEPFCTTKASGMGMGLSICRSIVQAHGGRLTLIANEPRGAVFQFTVPAPMMASADSHRTLRDGN